MSAIALTTANRVEVLESTSQKTLPCGVAVTAGDPVYVDTGGNWAEANSTDAGHSTGVYIATRSAPKGDSVTGVRAGKMDGWALAGLAYGASVFLQDAGGVGTTAGTVSVVLGRVIPATAQPFGTAKDKILHVACPA